MCERDDSRGRVLLWSSSVLPANIRVFPAIEMMQFNSYLLSMLLAPAGGR